MISDERGVSMKKYYVVTMNDGSEWGVPAQIIAKNKADYYADGDDNVWNEEYNAMMEWFDTNDFEFADWAKNNMDWDDVKADAILLEKSSLPADYQERWMNGGYEYRKVDDNAD